MKKAADADPKAVAEVQNAHTKVATFARRPQRQQQRPTTPGRGGQQQRTRFATNRVRRLHEVVSGPTYDLAMSQLHDHPPPDNNSSGEDGVEL